MHPLRRVALRNATRAASTTAAPSPSGTAKPSPPPSSKGATTQSGKKAKLSPAPVKSSSPKVPEIAKDPFYRRPPLQLDKKEFRERKKRLLLPRRRPQISNFAPKNYSRPIPKGIVPAYDLALQLIAEDSGNIQKEAEELAKQIINAEQPLREAEKAAESLRKKQDLTAEETSLLASHEKIISETPRANEMRDKLGILQVQAKTNDPETRWKIQNAMVDMSIPVHRYLEEQKWRKNGNLDLLMERVHQMNIVPDVIPVMHPSLDLQVVYRTPAREFLQSLPNSERLPNQQRPTAPPEEDVERDTEADRHWRNKHHGLKRRKVQMQVEPGTYLDSRQTQLAPKLYTRVFHPDTRLYTLLMVDYDVPDPSNQSFTSFLHWLVPNVPLSATKPGYNHRILLPKVSHTPYLPPHPQKGTAYHRYATFLLPQAPLDGVAYPPNGRVQDKLYEPGLISGSQPTSKIITLPNQIEREGFDMRAFIKEFELNPALGGGVHMFREVWDEWVSSVIYPKVLKKPEPVFGRPKIVPPHKAIMEELKGTRYFNPNEGEE
ncbi:phosphatidylethanolamine-binding protein [Flagelloscypha sp. PMI_526]|nr:phosphatidylethanolamine-binding protein [Flagelloscypha sp. PMI_526]